MMLAAWLSITWFLMCSGDALRPSALSRLFTLIWMYALSWVLLVGVTVSENNLKLGSGYFLVIYNAAIFVALLISYFELFGLPRKAVYADHAYYGPVRHENVDRPDSTMTAEDRPSARDEPSNAANDEDADERTSLLGRQTFIRYGAHRQRHDENDEDEHLTISTDPLVARAYEGEQGWSSSLPTWTWLLQFLILGPINLILVGQVALFVTSALGQTPADGNPVLTIYILISLASTFLILPLAPFIHRLKYQVPTLILLIFIGTLIYNLVAFPFSRDARLKVYFIQRLDLTTGENLVALTGLDGFVGDIAAQLPSTAGQDIRCGPNVTDWSRRNGLSTCVWNGLTPNVVPHSYFSTPDHGRGNGNGKGKAPYPNATLASSHTTDDKTSPMSTWLSLSASTSPASNSTVDKEVTFSLKGLNTRACRLTFDRPVTNLTVSGSGESSILASRHEAQEERQGIKGIKLWSRTWDAEFKVRVRVGVVASHAARKASAGAGEADSKDGGSTLKGKAVCQWADVNQIGTIPAFDEVRRFMPVWSIVSKGSDGLVEGFRDFEVELAG